MAKAVATCTCTECGKEFQATSFRRNTREADEWVKWAARHITVCDECEKNAAEEEKNRQNDEAATRSAERNYPELVGTPKQIAWANTLRDHAMERMEKWLSDDATQAFEKYHADDFRGILLRKVEASWWIDRKGQCEMCTSDSVAFGALQRLMQDADHERLSELAVAHRAWYHAGRPDPATMDAAPERPTVVPVDQKYQASAMIVSGENRFGVPCVYATFPEKNEEFRIIVKSMGMIWGDGRWNKQMLENCMGVENYSAALGSRLLNAGFPVKFESANIAHSAVESGYTPINFRTIAWNKDDRRFLIRWPEENDHYAMARKLPGSKWERPYVTVPVSAWAAVQDFAMDNDYFISSAARQAMEEEETGTVCAKPAPAKEHIPADNTPEVRDGVLVDLIDDKA
ncbi:MAG: hypothetical protein IJ523_08840 [Succinivibrionaceae bacterium]|nr:hypothetical protein [Succinivibrionaceae bacterium]